MRLHNSLEKSIKERDTMERELKMKLDASSVDLRWAPGLGFYVHVSGKDLTKFEKVETEYGNTEARCIIARKSTRSYHLDVCLSILLSFDFIIILAESNYFRTEMDSSWQSYRLVQNDDTTRREEDI